MPEGGGSGGTEGNPSGGAPLENKNAAGPGRGAPRGNTNAAGGRGPLGNTNAAGHGAHLLGNKYEFVSKFALGNKNAAKKGLGVRIAAFAAKHGPPAYVAADQVLKKKNAENDEQADVAAQVKKKHKKGSGLLIAASAAEHDEQADVAADQVALFEAT